MRKRSSTVARLVPAAAFVAAALLPAPAARAQEPASTGEGGPAILSDIGWDQRLGASVPTDVVLRDETGAEVRLGDLLGKRPVVLSLVYYECPMLCDLSLSGLTSGLDTLSLDVGRDFDVLTLSFEPKETPDLAAAKKASVLERYKRPTAASGWRFLTGDAEAVRRVTEGVGFRYAWDEASLQYAHPSGVVVLTSDGRISRYIFGIEYAPRDLRLALIEASEGKVGTFVDQVVLYCYAYDPATGKYGLVIMRVLRLAGLATLLALGGFIALMLRRERRRARTATGGAPGAGPAPGGAAGATPEGRA